MDAEQQAYMFRLFETIADIGYLAGAARYHSGDSRADVQKFIAWAREFEATRRVVNGDDVYLGKDHMAPGSEYMGAIEEFTTAKLSEAGA